MRKNALSFATLLLATSMFWAQDNLVNSLKNNHSQNADFKFTIVKENGATPVKDQGSSGTCWSYTVNSFLESEMMRMGKQPVDLAEIFTARNVYKEKAKLYVLNDGHLAWGEGGALHDVINMYRKYGAVPQQAYSGLLHGQTRNNFKEMSAVIKAMLDTYVKNPAQRLSPNWLASIDYTLDSYLGEYPKIFNYNGKRYTPQSFAKEVVGINPDDYVELSSYKDYEYYKPFVVPVPDNWSHDRLWNVPMEDLTKILDYALQNGYTVGWATDVSEPYFSYKNGVAYVPDLDLYNMTSTEKTSLFDGPKPDKKELGKVSRELFAQFLMRIYKEIPYCKLGEFSKLKILQAPNSSDFRKNFRAKLEKIFLTPANTFDNVKGEFPIGFKIWNTEKKETFKYIEADIYNKKAEFIGTKNIYCYDNDKFINEWLDNYIKKLTSEKSIGFLNIKSNDFQHNNRLLIGFENALGTGDRHRAINQNNLSIISIYFAVRHCIPADWLNDRDQFLYPNEGWQTDTEFQNDCLAFTLFHGQNRISATKSINHCLPFREEDLNAHQRFESHFMMDFIQGKIKDGSTGNRLLLEESMPKLIPKTPLQFSAEAEAVFVAGKALWQYYYQQTEQAFLQADATQKKQINDASFYDIRMHFQGKNAKGNMNTRSQDAHYMELISALREAQKSLALKIEPKVYEYGFLKR